MNAFSRRRSATQLSHRLAQIAQCAVSLTCIGAVAQAQERDVQDRRVLDEVVVTAQKRSESLRDVPVPVSTISAETLLSNGQLRIEDYYRQIPGLSVNLAGNGNEPQVIIRGVVTGPGNPTVGTVIDEVSYGRSIAAGSSVTAPDVDPNDLSRVEVLRGPQGTLYGASSMGGLLKFVTVDPSTEGFGGRIQAGSTHVRYGDDLGYNVRGAVNVPLSNTLAARISGFTARDPGYVDNPETGERDVNSRDSEGGRLAALWQPSENFSVKLSALMQDSKRAAMAEFNPALGAEPQRSALRGTGTYERKSEAYSATMSATLGPVELVSASGYSIDEASSTTDFTTFFGALANTRFGVPRASALIEGQTEKLSQELRFTLPLGSRITWLTGLFYTEEEIQSHTRVFANGNSGDIAGILIENAVLPATTFEERAIFTNLTVDITDRFDVQFGGRFSENEQLFVRTSGAVVLPQSRSEDSSFT